MMRALVTGGVMIAGVVGGASQFEAPYVPEAPYVQQQQPTFRTRADVVAVDVSVRDGSRVVSNLKAEDFEVYDNDVLQQVTDVSYGKVPIDVTVILDVSQSVTGQTLTALRRAVLQLARDKGKQDRLKLMTFNMRVSRVVDFTTETPDVERALRMTQGGGGSSIWDAMAVALVSASDPDRRQLVMLFSDSADTSSTLDAEALVGLAQRTTAAISAVVPGSGLQFLQRPGLPVLRRLATESGGGVYGVSVGGSDLSSVFQRALDQFRSSYVLHFTPNGVERTGFHALRVSVKDRKTVQITARRGYFW
jgi:VWFA-related protein